MICIVLWMAVFQNPLPDLKGSWKLVRQDGFDKVAQEEFLHFYPNGDLLIEGSIVYKGKFELTKDALVTIVTANGEEQRLSRKYTFANGVLSLAIDKGFGHYERASMPMPDFKKGIWRKLTVGFFAVEAPADWVIQKEPGQNGSQRMVFQEPSGESAVTLMRIPGRGKPVDMANALKGVMAPMLQGLEISDTVIHQNQGTYYRRVGMRLEASKDLPDSKKKLIVHTFGQKLKNDAFLVVLSSFVEGKEATLEKILTSLVTPDDPDLKKAQAELAQELAAQAKAKEEAEKAHNHSHGH